MANSSEPRKEPAPRRRTTSRRARGKREDATAVPTSVGVTPSMPSTDASATSSPPAAAPTAPAPARTASASTRPASAKHDGAPRHDEIARRAYEIYQARGGQHGADVEDWLRAERELRERRRAS